MTEEKNNAVDLTAIDHEFAQRSARPALSPKMAAFRRDAALQFALSALSVVPVSSTQSESIAVVMEVAVDLADALVARLEATR